MNDRICTVEGCNEKRMVSGDGKTLLTMCPDHQREAWRAQKAEAREREGVPMSPRQQDALKLLYERRFVDDGWIGVGNSTVHHRTAAWLDAQGYAEYDPDRGRARIRDAGRALVTQHAHEAAQREDAQRVLEEEAGHKPPAKLRIEASGVELAMETIEEDVSGDAVTSSTNQGNGNCEGCGCLYRDVVNLLREKYPAVDELVKLKHQEKAVLQALGLNGH